MYELFLKIINSMTFKKALKFNVILYITMYEMAFFLCSLTQTRHLRGFSFSVTV